MKRLLAKSILLAGGMTVSSQLLALGLGEMNLDSALNQPLRADIALIDTAGLSIAEMKPKLASANDFERAGVERYQFLTQMKFSVNGDRIVVTTRDPINEPFLNFLVELNWPSGRVLREYTVLLDPPIFEEGRVQPLVAVPAGAITSNTTVTTQPQATPAPTKKPTQNRQWSQPAAPGEYKVQPDDTLWQIALDTRPNRSISPQQMMVALQDVNPDAFINGNINRLKTHTTLIVPDESIIRTIGGQEAVVEVQRQNREVTTASTAQIDATGRTSDTSGPRKTTGGGEVRLLSSKADGQSQQAGGSVSGATGNTASTEDDLSIALENLDKSQRENQELVDRLTALEQQLAKMERLITLQNDQMASMSAGIAAKQAEQGEVSNTVTSETTDIAAPQVAVVEEPAMADDSKATATDTEASDAAVVATEVATDDDAVEVADGDNAVVANEGAATNAPESTDYNYQDDSADDAELIAQQKAEEAAKLAMQERAAAEARKSAEAAAQSPVDKIISKVVNAPIEAIAIGAGLILALIAGLLMLRRRKKEEEQAFDEVMADDSVASDLDDPDNLNSFELPGGLDDQPAFGETANSDDSLEHFDLNDGLGEMPVSDDLDDLDLDGYSDGEADQYETVGQTEDAISESDIYIAYGKFDQAVELLTGAIAAEPERVDLRLKHLEILSSLDDNDAFSKAEGNLNALGDEDANTQAEELRSQLSRPIAPVAPSDNDGVLSLDGELPTLDESAESEFDDGMDFGEALDFGDDVVPEDDGIGSTLESVPELELGESSDFDAKGEGVDMSLEDDAVKLDDDLLAFDLDDDEEDSLDKIDAIEADIADDLGDTKDESELKSFDFDSKAEPLSDEVTDLEDELEELTFELPADESKDDDLLNLETMSEAAETTDEDKADEDKTVEGEIESLDELDSELLDLSEGEADKLDFEAVPALGANDELDDLLDTEDVALELADGELQIDLPEDDELAEAGSSIDSVDLDDDIFDLSELTDTEDDDVSALATESDIQADDVDESLDLDDLLDAPLDVEVDSADELSEDTAEELTLDEVEEADDLAELLVADTAEESTDDSKVETEETIEEPLVAEDDNDDFSDLEDLMSSDAEGLAENSDLIGGIDLDELAAADDEFDFLAGTDECATKLDLARAYVDMEDADGARELLQEVIQEGNDEQKSEAKDLMDKLS
jgi:pilus assembly protein FimV